MSYIKYPTPTEAQCIGAPSETFKYRHLTAPHLSGVGVDIGSQGATVVPWAISYDLPEPLFSKYAGGHPAKGPIHLRGMGDALPFEDKSLDWIYSSHWIEDLERRQWITLFRHWSMKVRSGGKIVILVPEVERWEAYVARGGVHNFSHQKPEPSLGEIATYGKAAGLSCEKEEFTNVYPGDYTIMGVLVVP